MEREGSVRSSQDVLDMNIRFSQCGGDLHVCSVTFCWRSHAVCALYCFSDRAVRNSPISFCCFAWQDRNENKPNQTRRWQERVGFPKPWGHGEKYMKKLPAKGLIPHPDLSWLSVEAGKLTLDIKDKRWDKGDNFAVATPISFGKCQYSCQSWEIAVSTLGCVSNVLVLIRCLRSVQEKCLNCWTLLFHNTV